LLAGGQVVALKPPAGRLPGGPGPVFSIDRLPRRPACRITSKQAFA